eukprot:10626730-Alexandrium_andersonii.AAC.1
MTSVELDTGHAIRAGTDRTREGYMRIWDTDFGRAFPYDSFAPSQIAMPDRTFVTRDITLG